MSEEDDLPMKLKILSALGIAKVTAKPKPKRKVSSRTLPKGFDDYEPFTRPRRRRNVGSYIVPIGIMIPVLLAFVGLLDINTTENQIEEATNLRDKAQIIADKEGKMDWADKTWDNPETAGKLQLIKQDVDQANCETLAKMLENERWTLRAYVAHTILENGC